jgi:nicotinate-nucleotide adenylyltransferase
MTQASGLLGVYGGTFDPIHLGHLRAAEQVVEMLELERMLFVPSGTPPHKRGHGIAPAQRRLEWVRRAVAANKRFEADGLEVERDGPSFTVDTLRAIGARVAPERPVFVIGCDALADFGTWREPEAILELAHLAVVARGGDVASGALERHFPRSLCGPLAFEPGGRAARHRSAGTWLRWLEIEALPISATDLRARLRSGRSIRYLVPEEIHEDVVASGFYAGGEAGGSRG